MPNGQPQRKSVRQLCLVGNVEQKLINDIKNEITAQTELLKIIVVPYELYELYDWRKVPELYGTL